MPRKNIQDSIHLLVRKLIQTKVRICLLAVALLLAACSRAEPPRQNKRGAGDLTPQGTPVTSIPVSEAETFLLQKSVARVLAFTDVGRIALTVFQDAESALFNTIAAQEGTPAGVAPQPIFYHSPVFIAAPPELLELTNGNIEIKIQNRFPQRAIRGLIEEELGETLRAYNVDLDRIRLIPLENVKIKIRAFGYDYEIPQDLTDSELNEILFEIPASVVPEQVLKEMESQSNRQDAAQVFLKRIGRIQISFDYFVQQYGTQQCLLNISEEDIRNLYADDEGCPPDATPEDIEAGLDYLQKANNPNAIQATAATYATTLSASRAVTACMAAKEMRKIQSAASISCTKRDVQYDPNNPSEFSPMVMDFLQSSLKPAFTEAVTLTDDPATWDDKMMESAIQMFGNPERFVSVLQSINNKSEYIDTLEKDDRFYDERAWLVDTLQQYDSFRQKDTVSDNKSMTNSENFDSNYNNTQNSGRNSSSKGGGMGIGFGPISIGGSMGGANGNSFANSKTDFNQNYSANSDFRSNYDRFHEMMREAKKETSTEAESTVNEIEQYLYEQDIDHEVSNLTGDFKIWPRVQIHVAVDKETLRRNASSFSTNELGKIVRESDNIPVQASDFQAPQLIVQFQCTEDGSWLTVSQEINSYGWYKREDFWEALAGKMKNALEQGGCSFFAVKMHYEGVTENTYIIPERAINLAIHGVTVDANNPNRESKSPPISVRLTKEHNERSPIAGDTAVRNRTGQTYTKIWIRH